MKTGLAFDKPSIRNHNLYVGLPQFLELLGVAAGLGFFAGVGKAITSYDESEGARSIMKWLVVAVVCAALATAFYSASGEIESARCTRGEIQNC